MARFWINSVDDTWGDIALYAYGGCRKHEANEIIAAYTALLFSPLDLDIGPSGALGEVGGGIGAAT